jgi:outer membrane protein assembly factor BamB
MRRREVLTSGAVTITAITAGCVERIDRWQTDWTINSSWRTYRTATNANYVPERTGPTTGEVLWQKTIASNDDVQPVVTANTVYFGSENGVLHAVHGPTGHHEWRSTVDPGESTFGVTTTPAVLGTTVVVGVHDTGIVGVDRSSGDRVWSIPLEGNFRGNGFAIDDGTGYISTEDGRVISFDQDGTHHWTARIPIEDDSAVHRSPLVATDDQLYVTTEDGLFALDPDGGTVDWTFARGKTGINGPVVNDGVLYGGFGPGVTTGEGSELSALDAQTGEQRWSRPLHRATPHAPSTDGETLYVGDTDPFRVLALDPETGETKWTTETQTPVNDAPTITDDALFAPTMNGLVVLNPTTGAVRQRIVPDLDVPMFTPPCIVDDVAVFSTVSGTVYAVGGP